MTWQFIKPNRPVNHGSFLTTDLQIEWVDSTDLVKGISYQTLLLDLECWDQYWQHDSCNFVPENLNKFPTDCCKTEHEWSQEVAMHRQKIQRWQNQLKQGGKIPAVCFEQALNQKRIRIRQGRHRIAYLRSINLPAFAAAIPQDRLEDIRPFEYLKGT